VDLSLEQRMLRFLWREEEGERRSSLDTRALPADERVLEGECIQGARFIGSRGADAFVFETAENLSKFRLGDAVVVGDGVDFEAGDPMVYAGYDADAHRLTLERDPFRRGHRYDLEPGEIYCVDRRPLGLRGRLQEVVQAGFADDTIRAVLEGEHELVADDDRYERARATLGKTELNEGQIEAGARAIASESLSLIQGPPGTGKTRLLAEVLHALCQAGCRIALTGFTHRAVDNALLTLRGLAPELPLVKLGARNNDELAAAGIRFANPRRSSLPRGGAVIAGTCFALAKLPARERFHFAVFDEAGQLPIPHAIAGMLLARRWIFVGDHKQLPPVITSHHADPEVTTSVFEHLHDRYGSHMLELTYRMSDPLCAVIGETFYGGRLLSAVPDRRMQFRPGGKLDEVLDPAQPAVLARVDHLQPGMRSGEEAALIADLLDDLRRQHEIPPEQIAVVAPFRAQVRLIRSALQRQAVPDQEQVVVDTVERMQGQEREVILISLAAGDPDTLNSRSAFFFSTNRLNVAMSRARTKVVLVASRGAFRALPMDPHSLRAASLFKTLYRRLPHVDLTKVYGARLR
jgi:DNA replication ATP-dependent helicase Dna2